jgi:hypothetical protein
MAGLTSAAILALGPMYGQAATLVDPEFSTVISTGSGPFTDAEQSGWYTATPGQIWTGSGLAFNTTGANAAGIWQVVPVNPAVAKTLALGIEYTFFDFGVPGDVLWEIAVTGFSSPSFSAGLSDPATLAGLGLAQPGLPATGTALASFGSASSGVVPFGPGTASIPFTYGVGTEYLLITAYAENAGFQSQNFLTISSVAVPEPGAIVLGGIAVLSLAAIRRRRG